MKQTLYIFNDRAHAGRFFYGLILLTFFCLLKAALWQPAMAQDSVMGFSGFSCNAGQAQGNLFAADTLSNTIANTDGSTTTANAPDTEYAGSNPTGTSGPCGANLGVFGRLICFFKTTIGQIMSSMYCGFQEALRGPLNAFMTLFIVTWGILITTGMAQVTRKDSFPVIFKLILVWVFATNADWGIGVGYRFFMAVAEGGSKLVLDAMNAATGQNVSLTQPDAVLLSVFNVAAADLHSGAHTTMPANLSGLSISGYCATMLAPVLLSLLVTVPAVAIFIIIMIVMYIGLYARALLGYLTALLLISFLFVLAPLFVSFALFRATEKMFQQWVSYLITYSIQMVIVFAFLAMLEMVPIGTFMLNVTNLLHEYDTTQRVHYNVIPIHTCGICDPTITANGIPGTINPSTVNMLTTTSPLKCTPVAATSAPPAGEILSRPDDAGNVYDVIPLLNLLQHQDFISFMVAEVIALWLVGYMMEDFLKKAPDIAKQIGGLPQALVLGGAAFPGGATPNFVGLQSVGAGFQGFKQGLEKDPLSLNWPRRIVNSVKGFGDGLLHGAPADPDNPVSEALAAQGHQAALRTNVMQENYMQAQQLTLSTHDSMQQNMQELDALKASPYASPADIDAAIARLAQSQKNYNLATGNEAQRLKLLGNNYQNADAIYQNIGKTMLPGLLNKEVEGNVVGEGGLETDFFKSSTSDPEPSAASPTGVVPPEDNN